MSAAPATVLAFDYGQRRIGVAVGQTVTATASPLGTVDVRGGHPDWEAIAALVREWHPGALVVGLPLALDGSEQTTTRWARRFARRLEARYELPVHLVDERLTTREARARLAELGQHDPADDPVAAQVILESWLGGALEA